MRPYRANFIQKRNLSAFWKTTQLISRQLVLAFGFIKIHTEGKRNIRGRLILWNVSFSQRIIKTCRTVSQN